MSLNEDYIDSLLKLHANGGLSEEGDKRLTSEQIDKAVALAEEWFKATVEHYLFNKSTRTGAIRDISKREFINYLTTLKKIGCE